jgi:hypothetical protein
LSDGELVIERRPPPIPATTPTMDSTLSAYELQRLENIARNKEVLTSLGLAQAAPIAPVSKRSKPKARPPTAPSRKSGRLASVPAPSVYVDSERSNGMVMLGGADAAEVVTKSARSDLVAAAEEPTDEDPAPDAEEQLFPSEAKARALATSLVPTTTSPTLITLTLHPQVYAELRAEKNLIARELDTAPRGAEPPLP